MKKTTTSKNLYLALVIVTCGFMITACSPENSTVNDDFEKQVQDYLQKFPYQETYRYAMLQTGGDPAKLNTWVDTPRGLLKAGEDKVVRSNNDTLYKMAWVYLGKGPVVLTSAAPSKQRFSSFQLQDDRNANYRNIIYPEGSYTLYYGEKPANIVGEAESMQRVFGLLKKVIDTDATVFLRGETQWIHPTGPGSVGVDTAALLGEERA